MSDLSRKYRERLEQMSGESRRKGQLDAAALQNDLAQRYNLQNAVRAMPKKSKKTTRESSSKRIRCNERKLNVSVQEEKNVCNSCEAVNSASASVCERCGYFLAGAFHAPLSMAQSRGLVAAPKPISTAMKDYEWESIEKELAFRQDSHCPICMEGFNRGYEVLLSCSHMYHRSCLQSFEKFMKTAERSCPICRTTNYQKKITRAGTKAYEAVCARTIQKNWRGHWCRCLYYDELKLFYKNGGFISSGYRKKFFEKELFSHTNRITKEATSMENEVKELFSSMDEVMKNNRELDMAFDLMMMERRNFEGLGGSLDFESTEMGREAGSIYEEKTEKTEDGTIIQWNELLEQAKRRRNADCAICMSGVCKNRNRRVVLLSCSHMFHQRCIMMLEQFVEETRSHPLCPMCRCPFEKRLLSRDCDAFENSGR